MKTDTRTLAARAAPLALLLAFPAARGLAEPVVVPGGTAAVRRLLGLAAPAPDRAFFLDVHRQLTSVARTSTSWSDNARRVALVDFVEDLDEWRRAHGCPATLSTRGPAWKATRGTLGWIGVKTQGEGRTVTFEPRVGSTESRRQAFVAALGFPVTDVLRRLGAGEDVTIACSDGEAELPLGLAAWRDTLDLDADDLTRSNAFLELVKRVPASRMLVALHAIDPRTRDETRTLLRTEKGSAGGWRILYDEALGGFTRFPEALVIRDGSFRLPGGPEADAVWADVVGAHPSDRHGFLTGLFNADGGKVAYVVDALRQLPPEAARAVVLGRAGGGPKAIKRFRRLYSSIEKAGENFEKVNRDPYDFTHLVPFLTFSEEGDLVVPGGAGLWLEALSGSRYPATEADLEELVQDAGRRSQAPEEFLRKLFRREVSGTSRDVPAQKRFLIVSALLDSRPVLRDPGTILLLFRGLERFLPAYGPLEDVPLEEPRAVRRYLLTLGRLDTAGVDRAAELRVGLFLASSELVAATCRSGALSPARSRELFSALLDLPLFASPGTAPEAGIEAFDRWLREGFLAGLRAEERAFVESVRGEKAAREAEYRAAAEARDTRVLERRAAARRAREEARAAAAELLEQLTAPPCLPDDSYPGPFPIPAYLDADALPLLHVRARPLAPETPPERLDGELPDVRPVLDASEPLPVLVHVEVPAAAPGPDELLATALGGFGRAVPFTWRGARYLYDPSADGVSRRTAVLSGQRGVRLAGLSEAAEALRILLEAARAGRAAPETLARLESALATGADTGTSGDPRIDDLVGDARDDLAGLRSLVKPKALARIPERLERVQALRAERSLEALAAHVYAANAPDPSDLAFADALFVRRHSLRWDDPKTGPVESPFGPTQVESLGAGKGSRITGSYSGLGDTLGLLHVERLAGTAQPALSNEQVATGLVGPVVRVTPTRLDDDALAFVALSCRATEEHAGALAASAGAARQEAWSELARGLVSQARIGDLASADPSELREHLSPSDLYRVGHRLALGATGAALPSAAAARDAWERLVRRFGAEEARRRLAELGPRPVHYAGRQRLADLDMPSYERLAEYVVPQLYADRLYDVKVAAARMAHRAGDPAPLLGLYLLPALETVLSRARSTHVFDWRPLVAAAASLSDADRDRFLEAALEAGRITRAEE